MANSPMAQALRLARRGRAHTSPNPLVGAVVVDDRTHNSCGLFEYVQGSTIASSAKSSGETDYTISYIENISNVTPGGVFYMNDQLVAVPTY